MTTTFYTKSEMIENLKSQISSKPATACRAVTRIYANQLHDEQAAKETRHYNRKGFTKADAKFCSKMAQLLRNGVTLSAAEVATLQKRMRKYAAQLVNGSIVEGKIRKVGRDSYVYER